VTEGEVNVRVKQWILDSGYEYKGVLSGYGKISIGGVSIDHQGNKIYPVETVWVEAQGSCSGVDKLLSGFIAILLAVNYDDLPSGILAMPHEEYDKLATYKEFLVNLSKSTTRPIGLLDVESMEVEWLNVAP